MSGMTPINPHAHGNTRPDAWTPQEDAILAELYVRGDPLSEIAGRLARTKSAAKQRLLVLKVRRPLRTPTLDGKPI